MNMKINDMFYTIQGEGRNAGRAAWFFRMPFCNLDCSWCDTEFNTFKPYSDTEVMSAFEKTKCRFAVITGGEPSMNKDVPRLIELLKRAKVEIAMESNGQFEAPAGVDHLTISPKRWSAKRKLPQPHLPFWFNHRNTPSEIKIVIDGDDALNAARAIYSDWESHLFNFRCNPNWYLSPEWDGRALHMPRIVQFVKENPQWKVNLQTHKILNVK